MPRDYGLGTQKLVYPDGSEEAGKSCKCKYGLGRNEGILGQFTGLMSQCKKALGVAVRSLGWGWVPSPVDDSSAGELITML